MPTTWLGTFQFVTLTSGCALGSSELTSRSAAWFGARIVLEQVSPESPAIFDFVLELYQTCSGDWESLVDSRISSEELHRFLTYAATFLSNVGNYFVRHNFNVMDDGSM